MTRVEMHTVRAVAVSVTPRLLQSIIVTLQLTQWASAGPCAGFSCSNHGKCRETGKLLNKRAKCNCDSFSLHALHETSCKSFRCPTVYKFRCINLSHVNWSRGEA